VDDDHNIASIRSVNIRSLSIQRKLLMSSNKVTIFESFLKENIGSEVLVVNTNIGMEVYYYSDHNYSTFIRESILLYTLKNLDPSKLKFRSNHNRDQVYKSFCEALMTFAQYPQIFLSYAKKFSYLKEKNRTSQFVVPILDEFFDEVLTVLTKTGKIPHFEKIKKVKNKLKKSDPDKTVIKNLISEILLKTHYN